MRKRLILVVAVMLGTLGFISNSAFAYVLNYALDGRLEDWGLTRYSYLQNGNTYYWFQNFNNAYPTDTNIDRKVHNNKREGGGSPWGGEAYDIEALYFNDDEYYLYFAMITSLPMTGAPGTTAGDLAIDFGGAPYTYDYGINTKGMSSPYGLKERNLILNPTWHYKNGNPIYMIDNTGSVVEQAEIYYWDAEAVGYVNEPETSVHTWILEGRIDRFLFDPLPLEDDPIRLLWSMNCVNDYIYTDGNFDSPPAPEPASLLLLGLGLLGILGLRRRKE